MVSKVLVVVYPTEKVATENQKKVQTTGSSSFAGLLTCLNTRERQEQTRAPVPTLPDLFTQQAQAQQSDNPKRQTRKRKSVQIDSGRTKRTKIDASAWPEPGNRYHGELNIT
jgi:hypothetical protein